MRFTFPVYWPCLFLSGIAFFDPWGAGVPVTLIWMRGPVVALCGVLRGSKMVGWVVVPLGGVSSPCGALVAFWWGVLSWVLFVGFGVFFTVVLFHVI